MTLSLAEMAREIERRHATALPRGIKVIGNTIWYINPGGYSHGPVIDDLAHAILRDAMVMVMRVARNSSGNGWHVFRMNGTFHALDVILDADHGGCPTRSLLAAFCEVIPEVTK